MSEELQTSKALFKGHDIHKKSEKHGMRNLRVWAIWSSMHYRCKDKDNDRYGGRGIRVCERWGSFLNFLEDMGNPDKDMTIDRIDSDGHYEKDNCRWATYTEQNRNRSTNIRLTYRSETKCLSEWAMECGYNSQSFISRIWQGWPIEKAMETPCQKNRFITHAGVTKSLTEWAKELGISVGSMHRRLANRSIEDALTTPKRR